MSNSYMNYNIDITVDDDNWQNELADCENVCSKALIATFDNQKLNEIAGDIEVSIVLSNDKNIKKLNSQYRQKDRPTNVLSFPVDDFQYPELADICNKYKSAKQPFLLGDIVLAFETIKRESEEQDKSFCNHLSHLVVHAGLHLLGYDHMEDKEAEHMEQLEIGILKTLGVVNPY